MSSAQICKCWDLACRTNRSQMQTLLLPVQVPQLVRLAMSAVRTAVLLAAAVLCHAYGPAVQIGSAIIVGGAIGYSGYRKGSLSASGDQFATPTTASLLHLPVCSIKTWMRQS